MDRGTIDRRTFVWRTAAATGTIALAGCTESDGETGEDGDGDGTDEADGDVDAVPEIVEVEDPPEAVYVPTHREAMRTLDPIETGDVAVAPMLSYPHPFWIVAGGEGEESVERVAPEEGRGVHMMFTVWDRETETVLPVDDGAQIRVFRDGEEVGSPLSPWTMISQEMGFHFGDNVSLPDDGTYAVEVEFPPLSTRRTGALEDRLSDGVTAEFEFVYDDEFREAVVGGVEYLDEELWGERGALEPMNHAGHAHGEEDDEGHDSHGDDDEHGDHDGGDGEHSHHDHGDADHGDEHDHYEIPYSQLPALEEYPGTVLADADGNALDEDGDLPRSGDAAFVATFLDDETHLADGDDQYLLVSPRTPYNRVPLADMAITATIERDGETVAAPSLEQTLDGEYGLHYGAAVEDVRSGDTVAIDVESPPQVARHQGYETAFLEMPSIELVVPEEP
jgi:hypothetical protein